MSPHDDELVRLMRASDPAITPANADLRPHQLLIRDRITQPAMTPARSRRQFVWPAALVSVATAMVAVLAIVFAFPVAPRAAAQTPPPVELTDATQSLEEAISTAQALLRDADEGVLPERASTSTGWYLSATELPDETVNVAISPEDRELSWNPDGSGTLLVVAGEPYWANGDPAKVTPEDAPAPGAVIQDVDFAPGEYLPTELAAEDVDGPSLLAAYGTASDTGASEVIDSIKWILFDWTLDGRHEAELLHGLLNAPGARVAGTGTDRSGEEIVAISADSDVYLGIRNTILISARTGRIVGAETLRTTDDGGIPAGTVISYTMWTDRLN